MSTTELEIGRNYLLVAILGEESVELSVPRELDIDNAVDFARAVTKAYESAVLGIEDTKGRMVERLWEK